MTAQLSKAALITGPNDIGRTANDFGCLKYTAETTHAANAVPDAWKGRWVILFAVGGTIDVAFSESSSAEVDRGAAAAAGGTSSKVGVRVPSGEERHRIIPRSSKTVYLARESDTAGAALLVELSDREP